MTTQPNYLIDIATRGVFCLKETDSLGEAARVMSERRFSSIVVTDDANHPLGIVTERNILRAMHEGARPETPLRTTMSSPVVVLPSQTDILDGYQICLREGIRHLVLVDDAGAVAGVLSETDFRLHLNLTALAGRRNIAAIAKRSGIALPPDTRLVQALDLMHAQRKSCVIIVEHEKPVGIVTERDVVRFYSSNLNWHDILLGEVMISPVLTISSSASTAQAAEKMLSHKVRHLVSVDQRGCMVGLLSEHDLTQAMVSGLSEERAGIEESFLRTLINTVPDLIWLKNPEGVYLACNVRFERFFGHKEQDIIGKTDYDFVSHEQAEFFRKNDRIAMKNDGATSNEEWLTFAQDGYHGLFETVKTPMRDHRGRLIGVLGVARDISERQVMFERLEQSEREFRSLAETSPDNIIRYDKECRQIYANPVVLQVLQQLLGRNPHGETPNEAYADGSFKDYDAALRRVIASGQIEDFEFSLPDRGSGVEHHLIRMAAEKNAAGEVIGAIAFGRNITQIRQAEYKLRESQARLAQSEYLLRTLIEAIPDAIQFKDGEGRWLESNSAARAAFGLDAELSHNRSDLELSELAAPEFKPALQRCHETDEKIWQIGETARIEETIPASSGKKMVFDVIKVPLFNHDGSRKGLVVVGRDVSELKRTESALRKSLDDYSGLVQRIPVGVYKFRVRPDGSAAFEYVSQRWCELLDVTEAEVMNDPQAAFQHIDTAELKHFIDLNEKMRRELSRFVWEGPIRRKNGEVRWLHIESQPSILENGDILWDGIQYDITERRQSEEALRINASVFDTTQDAIIITDANNDIIDVNPAFTRITGYARDDVLGKNPRILSSGRQDNAFFQAMWDALLTQQAWRGEIWNRRKSGELFAELLSISVIRDEAGVVQRHVGVFSDITYFKEHEEELSRVANYDALTGIPNRRLLADRLEQAVIHAQRAEKLLAICYLDLDGFKEVNDQYGHKTGDELLINITHRLQEELRAGDTLARLGGDEFVVLFNDLSQESECFQVLERIMQIIATPVQLGAHQVAVSASIGVTFYPTHGEDGDSLLRHADQAMYIAKQTGKNRFHRYA